MARGKYKMKRIRKLRKETLLNKSALSEATVDILNEHGIRTLYELDHTPEADVRAMPGIGEKRFKEIQEETNHPEKIFEYLKLH